MLDQIIKVGNFKSLHQQVAKIQGVEYLSLWQRLNSFTWINQIDRGKTPFLIEPCFVRVLVKIHSKLFMSLSFLWLFLSALIYRLVGRDLRLEQSRTTSHSYTDNAENRVTSLIRREGGAQPPVTDKSVPKGVPELWSNIQTKNQRQNRELLL